MQKLKFCFCFIFFPLVGTRASPAEQLSVALAWDRADIAQKDILVSRQHWQVRPEGLQRWCKFTILCTQGIFYIIKLCIVKVVRHNP